MLSNYLQTIESQRDNNPNFKKDYYMLPLIRKNTTSLKEWEEIQRYTNTRVINIIQRTTPYFTDTQELYYYELVDTSPSYRTTFINWKYFYLPVEQYSQTLIDNNLLPSLKYYDVETVSYKLIYPTKQYLYASTRPGSYYTDSPLVNQTHPYSDNFIYTGINVSNNNGKVIYEYVDYKMLTDHISVLYYSDIKPKNYDLNADNADFFSLVDSFSLLEFIDAPPSKLMWSSNIKPDYRFTGRITNKQFSKSKEWYEYNLFSDNQPVKKVLLPDAPTLKDLNFVNIKSESKKKSLHFPIGYNRQRIIYKQTSTNNKIVIAP